MIGLLIALAAIVALFIGYMTYGAWLCKQWGIDPKRKTPAVEKEDGVDYVPAKPAVLMGHHFSSIAGAGPVTGPVQASIFGWLPVFLWCVLGSIFFGGLHDFGSLFASIRNGGKSIGDLIESSMGIRAKRLFLLFSILILILVLASFTNIVASTFFTVADEAGNVAVGLQTTPTENQSTAMISLLFILIAIAFGYATNRKGVRTLPATIVGIAAVVGIVIVGLNVGISASRTVWIVVIGVYITIASLVPVWILLQPRDYLSSFLLYGMIILALFGIISSAFNGNVTFDMPAFTSFEVNGQYLFPTLFITVACGACSGFHSLVASGTTSKQLDNEKNARLIGYGSMLIECAFAIIALVALGGVYSQYIAGQFSSPSVAFATGIALMFGGEGSSVYHTISALITLSISVFALTTLDTTARLGRFVFAEFFLKREENSYKDASGIRRFLAHPFVGTAIMVVIGCVLGEMSLSEIWGLLGSANQLLSCIALLAVASWLGHVGKNNKMFFIPMAFMLAATVTSLVLTIVSKANEIGMRTAEWGDYFQLVFAIAMGILAADIIVDGIRNFRKQAKERKAA